MDFSAAFCCSSFILFIPAAYLLLPPEQHSLLNQLLLESQTLVQGSHLPLHVRPLFLSQIPGEKGSRQNASLLREEKKTTSTSTAVVTEMLQSNF